MFFQTTSVVYNTKMKIIFLNAFEGKIDGINEFVLNQSFDTDIFCFQESYHFSNPKIFCLDQLKGYQLITNNKWTNDFDKYSNSTFFKKEYKNIDTQTIGQSNINVGLGLFTLLKTNNNKTINLLNFHGHARPGDKLDNLNRLHQSQLIIDFFKDLSGPKIIGGDFNLDFSTKSVQMFESNGYRNLIKEFNIPTTRNKIAWDQHQIKQLYADFLFVSPDVKVINFTVPNLLISDHLPLILEIEI